MNDQVLTLRFDHGLGDCANFAHILELYRRRGYRVRLHCAEDKTAVFAPLDVEIVQADCPGLRYVSYPEPMDPMLQYIDQYWVYNKIATNLTRSPLPAIGSPKDLWREVCAVKLCGTAAVGDLHENIVREFLAPLQEPIVLLHSMGNTFQDLKNVPPLSCLELYRHLLDRFDGTLILLDWDDRVPKLANYRVRHMTDDWQWIDVPTLLALMNRADLLISVDSGPLHLARFTDIPVLGLFPNIRQHPGRVALPRPQSVNIAPGQSTHDLNLRTRILYNILESGASEEFELNPEFVADVATRMLKCPRYLSCDQLGADLQLAASQVWWKLVVAS